MTNIKAPPSILVVEDEPDLLDNLRITLEGAGYRTLTARNGFEALAVLQAQSVDLILSDINMPRIGGYQLYKLVRENPRWSAIPFLFLTGCKFLSDGEIQYGKKLGIEEYLTKPIQPEYLLLVVESKLSTSLITDG